MRKLKLQMQISLDGFVTANGGANSNSDNEVRGFSIDNLKMCTAFYLDGNTAKDFIPHWAAVAGIPKDSNYKIGKLLTGIPNYYCFWGL